MKRHGRRSPPIRYLVVVRHADDAGPGRVLGSVTSSSPAAAVDAFRARRDVPELLRGVRLDAFPQRVLPGEVGTSGQARGWSEVEPGIWLYPPEVTAEKIGAYLPDLRARLGIVRCMLHPAREVAWAARVHTYADRCACGCAPCRAGDHHQHDVDTGTALCPAGQAAEDAARLGGGPG